MAWVARVDPASACVHVWAGERVEWGQTWLVEGVWEGLFSEHAFHTSDTFFGSGMVVRGQGVVFCASSALVDRLFVAQEEGGVCEVSNSLVALLAHRGALLDANHDYHAESHAVLQGLGAYNRMFHVLDTQAVCWMQVYGENAVWENGVLHFETREKKRAFQNYTTYAQHLAGVLEGVQRNAMDTHRRCSMGFYSTVSSGYDSAAVTAFVAKMPGLKVYTCAQSNTPVPHWVARRFSDDGTPVAQALGLGVRRLQPASLISAEDEMWFLAGNCADHESIFHSLAKDVRESGDVGVLFSGYHGDKVWDKHLSEAYVSRRVLRGDASGLALGEVRLWAGFVHVAVPFIGAREVQGLVCVARSEAMKPFSVGTHYDRPIPRRVCEEAGVPRHVFGVRKKAVARYVCLPHHKSLRAQVLGVLARKHQHAPWVLRAVMAANQAVFRVRRLWVRVWMRNRMRALKVATPRAYWMAHMDVQNEVYVWAVTTLSQKLRKQWEAL